MPRKAPAEVQEETSEVMNQAVEQAAEETIQAESTETQENPAEAAPVEVNEPEMNEAEASAVADRNEIWLRGKIQSVYQTLDAEDRRQNIMILTTPIMERQDGQFVPRSRTIEVNWGSSERAGVVMQQYQPGDHVTILGELHIYTVNRRLNMDIFGLKIGRTRRVGISQNNPQYEADANEAVFVGTLTAIERPVLRDAQGNPVLDANGNQQTRNGFALLRIEAVTANANSRNRGERHTRATIVAGGNVFRAMNSHMDRFAIGSKVEADCRVDLRTDRYGETLLGFTAHGLRTFDADGNPVTLELPPEFRPYPQNRRPRQRANVVEASDTAAALIRNVEAPAGDDAGVQDETAVPISHFPAESVQPVAPMDEQADRKPDEIEELDISSIE